MIFVNRLDTFVKQFRFQEGVRCVEASFTISETIIHMLERWSKYLATFLAFGYFLKAFATV